MLKYDQVMNFSCREGFAELRGVIFKQIQVTVSYELYKLETFCFHRCDHSVVCYKNMVLNNLYSSKVIAICNCSKISRREILSNPLHSLVKYQHNFGFCHKFGCQVREKFLK